MDYPVSKSTLCTKPTHNILGNAKLQGLVTQLDLIGNRYNIALVIILYFFGLDTGFRWLICETSSWTSDIQTMYFIVRKASHGWECRSLLQFSSHIAYLSVQRSWYFSITPGTHFLTPMFLPIVWCSRNFVLRGKYIVIMRFDMCFWSYTYFKVASGNYGKLVLCLSL